MSSVPENKPTQRLELAAESSVALWALSYAACAKGPSASSPLRSDVHGSTVSQDKLPIQQRIFRLDDICMRHSNVNEAAR